VRSMTSPIRTTPQAKRQTGEDMLTLACSPWHAHPGMLTSPGPSVHALLVSLQALTAYFMVLQAQLFPSCPGTLAPQSSGSPWSLQGLTGPFRDKESTDYLLRGAEVQLFPCSPGILVSCYPGILVSWYPGIPGTPGILYPAILVSWYPGILVSWHPGILVCWYPGILASVSLLSWYPGILLILVSCYPGILVSCYPGILLSWYPAVLVFWPFCLCSPGHSKESPLT